MNGIGIEDIRLRLAMGGMNEEEMEYAEKPRPSLFNVIKKLKETTGTSFNRLVYLAKINEHEFKGDIEKEIEKWTREACSTEEEGVEPMEPPQYGGFAVILGPWIVHLFEAEAPLINKYVHDLLKKQMSKGSYYNNIWVLHYTEDVPQRAYHSWTAKSVNTQSATREIKSYPHFEKIFTIYDSMVKIGVEAQQVQNKGANQVNQTMK